MKRRLSDFSLIIILYCSSLFVLVQPIILSILGDGATTQINIGLLFLMSVLFLIDALVKKSFHINHDYLFLYVLFAVGLAINFMAFSRQIQFPQKYYAAFIFVTISAILSSRDFNDKASLPTWAALPLASYFMVLVLQRIAATGFDAADRISLNDEVVSNLNYLPIAAFLLAVHFYTLGKRTPMLISATTVALLLVLTQSRSSFLGISAAILFLVLKQSRPNSSTMLRILGAVIVAWALFSLSGLQERFFTETDTTLTEGSGRLLLIFDIFERFQASPVVGAGFAVDNHIRYDPHNIFLEVVMQGGFVGMVTMVPILVLGIWSAFRINFDRPLAKFASTGLICLMVSGQFTGSVLLNLPLWLFIGLCLSLTKYKKSRCA